LSIDSIDVYESDEIMGHCDVEKMQKTAKIHGFKLTGSVELCQDCAKAKARQKNVNKDWKVEIKVLEKEFT
jgi:hypothetical protein